jgi:putative DNA primase/helicase
VKYPLDALVRKVAEVHDGKDLCVRGSDYASIANHAISLAGQDDFFVAAPVGLATPEGFYQIVGNEVSVTPLTPAHRQRVKIAVAPKSMPTPLFGEFLHDTFKSNVPGEELEQVALVQEIAGATMLGIMHRYQKAVLFYDRYGRAGKGTLERILRELVPPAFVTAVSPFNWDREYYIMLLAGARLNVYGELPDSESIPAAVFKTVTGGDLLTGRHPTQRPIKFKNEAAHLFMSNHLINTKDHSEAFFSRWLLVEFPNSRLLSGLPLDPGLADRIVHGELPGIAHWALEGAIRLMKNGRFSASKVHDRLMSQWRCTTNSLDEFIQDCCDLGEPHTCRRSLFYKLYINWCKDNGRRGFAKGNVKQLMLSNISMGIYLKEHDGYETFCGIQIKPKYIKELEAEAEAHESSLHRR